MCAAAAFGYFIGKISYLGICEERLAQLPDSKLGAAIRAKRAGKRNSFYENLTQDPTLALAPFQSAADIYSDDGRQVSIAFMKRFVMGLKIFTFMITVQCIKFGYRASNVQRTRRHV